MRSSRRKKNRAPKPHCLTTGAATGGGESILGTLGFAIPAKPSLFVGEFRRSLALARLLAACEWIRRTGRRAGRRTGRRAEFAAGLPRPRSCSRRPLLYPGSVPTWIDHALFALLAALFPIWATTFGFRRLKRASPSDLPRVRLSVYRTAIALQWTLVLVLAVVWVYFGRPASGLGLAPRLTPGLVGVAVGMAIVIVFMLRQRAEAVRDPESLAQVRTRLRRLERLLPRTSRELAWFYRLSLTAGICEELLYRGFLIWYLGHWFGLLQATGLAAAFFGLGHAYHGWLGILLTPVVGVFLCCVYLLTGSLFASMVIHALMDMHSGHLGYVALRDRPETDAGSVPGALLDAQPSEGADVMGDSTDRWADPSSSSWSGSGRWGVRRSAPSPGAAGPCWGSIASLPLMTWVPRMVKPASSARPTSSIRLTCLWFRGPISCGRSSSASPARS